VAGDLTRLAFATGLSALEQTLAKNMHFLAQNLPGVQQVRQFMGHQQFGARVNYGDVLFFTFSPNPQHSGLVLHLSRYRENDTFLGGDDNVDRCIRFNAGRDKPLMETVAAPVRERQAAAGSSGTPSASTRPTPCPQHGDSGDGDTTNACILCRLYRREKAAWHRRKRKIDEAEIELPLPSYESRRAVEARDPLAVMDAFTVHARLRLPTILGVRMCPRCPQCNAGNGVEGCQNRFGSNMRPMGGLAGASPGFGLAIEHQVHGPPHGHGNIHLANAYQYNTLHDIAKLIQDKLLDPQNILDFHAWLHREEPFDEETHEAQRDAIETAWRDRYAGHEHDAMSQTPVYMQNDQVQSLFDAKPCSVEAARVDGERFTKSYRADAQFIFSRVQHHFHKKTKKGYVPMPRACTSSRDKTVQTRLPEEAVD
jgi:hypothetical protein